MDRGGATSRLRLEPRPSSVSAARRLVRATLVEAGHEDLVDAAELATSELVTNALMHAGTDIELTVVVRGDGVRVEIVDGSAHLPETRRYGTAAGTGRGLLMVESLVDDWGITRDGAGPVGKVVWFEIGKSAAPAEASAQGEGESPRPRSGVVEVRLRNVPLLLHAAWQQHIVALLREHLLVTMGEHDGEKALQVHAQASDAIALLAEHLPRPELGEEPAQLLAASRDPSIARADLTLPVPIESVPHFAALNHVLELTIQSQAHDMFLTPTTQPELRAFRRWVCEQVAQQSRGEPPTPWPGEELTEWEAAAPVPNWDAARVASSDEALVVADDTGAIVGVSAPAAALLGYSSPTEMLGRRLVALIPPRYRQAHLAGFALHVYTGRRSMLDQPETLPVARKDGTEIEVEMVVRSSRLGEERTVFTATMRARREE